MAHFAQLNDNDVVVRVVSINNEELMDDGVELESKGIKLCEVLFGGRWLQTSYNNLLRKNYAGIGYIYDQVRDAFIPPKPEIGEWELDEETCRWLEVIL